MSANALGELRGYRVRYGVKDHHKLHETMLGPDVLTKNIKDLERGIEYGMCASTTCEWRRKEFFHAHFAFSK
jgi:hypothetical protein